MAKAVKLADIAAVVGVSTVTVSKALSDQKGVSEEMRQKIKNLAVEMGYQPVSSTKKPQIGKKYNIGVLIQEIYLDNYASFYGQMYRELTKKALLKGCFVMLEMVSRENVLNPKLPMLLEENKVDGIVVIGDMTKEYLEHLEESAGVPIVYMDYYDNGREVDTVVPNSFYGTYRLTNYLCDCGHRKIAYVGTVGATNSITDRYLGYTKSLIEHGIPYNPEWLIDDRDLVSGRIDEEHMLQLPKDMPTAFVCNCDLTASMLIKKLQKEGYRIPEDISIVGFDNYLYPGLCDIEITTYEVNIAEMVRRTLHKIIKKIGNEKYTKGMFIIDGHVVYKNSVARI